jgi:hypothetical protein
LIQIKGVKGRIVKNKTYKEPLLMSYFIDRISYFAQKRETFSDGHGVTTGENRGWEKAYRDQMGA